MGQARKGFTFLKWNGKYGSAANFIVEDNATGKQSFFTPERAKDTAWVANDLTKTPTAKGWQDFGNETVDNLQDVVF